MYSIYHLYCMNEMKIPFKIIRNTWVDLIITVDFVDNFHYSANDWRCDAYTKDENYKDFGYGSIIHANETIKLIGCGGNYCWLFAEKDHNENLIRPYREYNRPKSEKGLTLQKSQKIYSCRYCKKIIPKGILYERYSVRNASELGSINEIFCIGCRDKLREKYFKKPVKNITFSEVKKAWESKILV